MTGSATFELIATERLKIHEEIRPELVEHLVKEIRRDGVVREPILVARGTDVVLNGHHRFAALRALGARRVPAWVVDYDSEGIVLERWDDGPPLTKSEVIARAHSGSPYRPKTTKHTIRFRLPERPTPLAELGVPGQPTAGTLSRRSPSARAADGS